MYIQKYMSSHDHYIQYYMQSGLLIMNQAEVPNKYAPIAFVLNQVGLIWSFCIMNKIFGPKGIHNKKRSWLYTVFQLF